MSNHQTSNSPSTDQPIVKLSAAAVEKVKSMMTKESKENFGLRVGVTTGGCAGMSYDLRLQKDSYENDIILEQDGLKIFINPQIQSFIKGTQIDFKDTLKESGFQYKNPNAQSSCGCGTSFNYNEQKQ